MTANVRTALDQKDVFAAVSLHLLGDWGDVCQEDWQTNDVSLKEGSRLFSMYRDRNWKRFYVITEADRSATTVLLPEEY